MCIQPTSATLATPQQSRKPCPAKLLDASQRQTLAVHALAGTQTVVQMAADHEVSRKFVYVQADKAEQALQEAFAPAATRDDQVLFTIPVTKRWLRASGQLPESEMNGSGPKPEARNPQSGSVHAADQLAGIIDLGDAPTCSFCGSIMTRNGSCYRCGSCGSTSGCS